MRNRTPFVALVSALCLGACALVGVARAQGGPGAGAPPPAGTATLQRPVDLDTAEMVKRGDATVARIDQSGRTVRKQLEAARLSRDVVKTLCLSDRLTQLDVTLRSARERKAALDAAAQRKDKELASHEFTIIGVYRERSDRLVAEANQCVGSEVGMIGVTRTSLGVDPTIPDNEGGPFARVTPFPGGGLVPVLVPEPGPCESCAFLCTDSGETLDMTASSQHPFHRAFFRAAMTASFSIDLAHWFDQPGRGWARRTAALPSGAAVEAIF